MQTRRHLRPIDELRTTAPAVGDAPTSESTPPLPATIDLLGRAAQYASMQFQLLLDVSIDDEERRRAVPRALRAAVDLGAASGDAVDAFAHLVACVIDGDEREFARVATLAVRHLGGEDVHAGAGSVIEAFSHHIAAAAALEVTDVDDVLMAAWTQRSDRPHAPVRHAGRPHVRAMCRRR